MIALVLALRSLLGAGIRTWLNVVVLALVFFAVVWMQGLLAGWNHQARRDTIAWEIGGGQLQHAQYDSYDPLTLIDSHAPLPEGVQALVDQQLATPILVAQATIYPAGRMRGVILRGIATNQTILSLPSASLVQDDPDILPIAIGTAMARHTGLAEGDVMSLRWQDANGSYDAIEARVATLFQADVPAVDAGQIWVPLERLRSMLQMPGEATLIVFAPGVALPDDAAVTGWVPRSVAELLVDIDTLIRTKSSSSSILYLILLALAMLAIFDTQLLSIFRRQREIGTQIALGMTRWQVVRLFTVEGTMYGFFALGVAVVVGGPLLAWQAHVGFAMPGDYSDMGIAISDVIFPIYGLALLTKTAVLILGVTTLVSFMAAKRIASMSPIDAIRGKAQ
jgi:putative ABC transport system permease protein